MNFSKKTSKQQKGLVYQYVANLWRNFFYYIFIPFYWFKQKQLFKQIQIFLRFASFKHGKKNKLSEYYSARFCDNNFCLKRNVLYEFPPKCFKTTERPSLAVCGALCGKKHFLLIFIPFTGLIKKQLLN